LRERAVRSIYDEMGVPRAQQPDPSDVATITRSAQKLTWFSFIDILVFFGVILVGFAYVWMRGDLDWVRAIGRERAAVPAQAAVHRPPLKQTAVA
jgi:NADH-quinone oxidoreductase subunit A